MIGIDPTTMNEILGAFVGVLVLALVVLVPLGIWRIRVANDKDAHDKLATAADAAAGLAYHHAATQDGGALTPSAVAVGANYLKTRMAGPIARFKLTAQEVEDMVKARIGKQMSGSATPVAKLPPTP